MHYLPILCTLMPMAMVLQNPISLSTLLSFYLFIYFFSNTLMQGVTIPFCTCKAKQVKEKKSIKFPHYLNSVTTHFLFIYFCINFPIIIIRKTFFLLSSNPNKFCLPSPSLIIIMVTLVPTTSIELDLNRSVWWKINHECQWSSKNNRSSTNA